MNECYTIEDTKVVALADGNTLKHRKFIDKECWSIYDSRGREVHYRNCDGEEYSKEYDNRGNMIHYSDNEGNEYWQKFNSKNKVISVAYANGVRKWYNEHNMEITLREFNDMQRRERDNERI